MTTATSRRQMIARAAGVGAAALIAYPLRAREAQTTPQPARVPGEPMFIPAAEAKWERLPPFPTAPIPKPGDPWPEIAILRVDPGTQATQLMIRVPKNFHVPKHWHTANETHTIVSGTFVMECEGRKAELGPGSFNYMPSKMVHEARTKPDEGTLLFITVDGAWDVNFVGAQPSGR